VVEVAKLSARHQRFVQEFCLDGNATAAARRAGYNQRTARNTGHRLLRHPSIQEAIAVAQADVQARAGDSAERVVRDLLKACEGAAEDRSWAALGKLLELRCKVEGMLVDRHRVEGADGAAPTIVLRWADS
jgi:phage terminase small subunit